MRVTHETHNLLAKHLFAQLANPINTIIISVYGLLFEVFCLPDHSRDLEHNSHLHTISMYAEGVTSQPVCFNKDLNLHEDT